jgi:hypothetical protein
MTFLVPKKRELLLFVLILFPVIAIGLWELSFTWFPPLEFYLLCIFMVCIFLFALAKGVEMKWKVKLSRYISVFMLELFILTVANYVLRNYLRSRAEEHGELIVAHMAEYHELNGQWPEDLNHSSLQNLPKNTPFGTKYELKLSHKTNNPIISFYSFGGYWGYYDYENDKWYYND